MELKVYRNASDFSKNKTLLSEKIDCPDLFSFDSAYNVFKSLFPNCVLVLVAV